jgi:hypothetical protein
MLPLAKPTAIGFILRIMRHIADRLTEISMWLTLMGLLWISAKVAFLQGLLSLPP